MLKTVKEDIEKKPAWHKKNFAELHTPLDYRNGLYPIQLSSRVPQWAILYLFRV